MLEPYDLEWFSPERITLLQEATERRVPFGEKSPVSRQECPHHETNVYTTILHRVQPSWFRSILRMSCTCTRLVARQ